MIPPDKLPPINLEAELGVLGSILLDNDKYDDVASIVRPEDFYRDAHQVLFRQIASLITSGTPVDAITLIDHLQASGNFQRAGGDDLIRQALEQVPHAANAEYYATIVGEKAVSRRLIEAAYKILEQGYSNKYTAQELIESAEKLIFSVADNRRRHEVTDAASAVQTAIQQINVRAAGEITGIPSGFEDLDDITGGFQDETLIILAARPSMGKSALALNVCENVSIKFKRCPFLVSLEMSKPELGHRLIQSQGQIDGHMLRNAFNLTNAQKSEIARVSDLMSGHAFPIDTGSSRTLPEIASMARKLKTRSHNPIDMIVVDYLQIVSSNDRDNRQEQVAKISKGLKQLARDLKVPVIALSQLSRQVENREDKRPRLADLRESGAIEQDADLVLMLHRPEYYDKEDSPGLADLDIAKNRMGPTGRIRLRFEGPIARFSTHNADLPPEIATTTKTNGEFYQAF